jgi:hypothetical protein
LRMSQRLRLSCSYSEQKPGLTMVEFMEEPSISGRESRSGPLSWCGSKTGFSEAWNQNNYRITGWLTEGLLSWMLDYVCYYNSTRLHSTLEYKIPFAYEKELCSKAALNNVSVFTRPQHPLLKNRYQLDSYLDNISLS